MSEKRDYYEVLGVTKESSPDEIKKAYRKLAKIYHPDTTSLPKEEAEEKFKEASEAYEVLSDPEKKARYDQYGMAGMEGAFGQGGFDMNSDFSHFGDLNDIFGDIFGFGGGSRRRQRSTGPAPGDDLRYDIEISLKEAFEGVSKQIKVPHTVECKSCNGTGGKGGNVKTCSQCGGQGRVRQVQRTIFGQGIVESECPKCNGQGTLYETMCPDCRGKGRSNKTATVDVKIPAGVDTGNRLRVPGAGDSGYRGGPAGDLYVYIRVKDDKEFVREREHLHVVAEISYSKLVLGGTVEVKNIEGKTIEITVPAGTQVGEVLRVPGQGMPTINSGYRGNLYVTTGIKIPKKVTSEEKELLLKLDETAGTKSGAKKAKKGIFGK